MSLLELLQHAYSTEKNYEDQNFISRKTTTEIVTRDRINDWSRDHPLCLEHEHESKDPHHIHLINQILRTNLFVFVVLVFAKLEVLSKKLIASGSTDVMLFDTVAFKRVCDSAGLNEEQKQGLVSHRKHVGVIFVTRGWQDIPRDAILPFYKRESLEKHGSYGALYRVVICGKHLRDYNDTAIFAEKRIRPDTNSSRDYQERLFREVKTLRKRNNHPNIIPLLAAYTQETNESGYYVKVLHLLFPLAEMDLADWMSQSQTPSNVQSLSRQERQHHIYRAIHGLASGISYLHREIDGTVTTHHDLKPGNILVIDDILKIADFGHSNLHSVIEGSATEGASGLGTYEYQPPEYFSPDGSRSQIKHGRAFDVWALGCIIIELSILIVHGWQSRMINEFRKDRRNNSKRDRKSPVSVDRSTDVSFHNNKIIVEAWGIRLRHDGASQQLDEVLNIADGMLVPDPMNRPYIWEIQLDLYKALRYYGELIPDLDGDLCVSPPFKGHEPDVHNDKDTPLHRAIKKNNRTRTIRLWELGWPLSRPDSNGETPLDLIKKSDDIEIQKLEEGVIEMMEYVRSGETEELKELFSGGLSPVMVNRDERSALYEAITAGKINVVDCLLETKAKEQIMLWSRRNPELELPIHTAARVGFVAALERILKHHPHVIDIHHQGNRTALHYAAEYQRADAVRLLLDNGAKVLPPKVPGRMTTETPLHAAVRWGDRQEVCEIIKLLLDAPGGLECMELKEGFGMTPLLLAAYDGSVRCFETLLQHGASVHAMWHGRNLMRLLAMQGRHNLLQQCIEKIPLEEFGSGDYSTALSEAVEEAQSNGHKEVVQLLKGYQRQASRSSGSGSGLRAFLRGGLGKSKGR